MFIKISLLKRSGPIGSVLVLIFMYFQLCFLSFAGRSLERSWNILVRAARGCHPRKQKWSGLV